MRASNESVEMLLMIIIGTGREVRFCIQKIGDVSVLYYREKETGDSKRPSLRVVAVEDLRETLIGVHEQVVMGGRPELLSGACKSPLAHSKLPWSCGWRGLPCTIFVFQSSWPWGGPEWRRYLGSMFPEVCQASLQTP